MEGKPSTSKCQALSVFDDDNPEGAKQGITDAVHYCLHLMQKGIYITDHVLVFHHSQRKWEMKLKHDPQYDSKLQFHLRRVTANSGRMAASGS
jgi:hypothetical protein